MDYDMTRTAAIREFVSLAGYYPSGRLIAAMADLLDQGWEPEDAAAQVVETNVDA